MYNPSRGYIFGGISTEVVPKPGGCNDILVIYVVAYTSDVSTTKLLLQN
jgi:hypothetical protein